MASRYLKLSAGAAAALPASSEIQPLPEAVAEDYRTAHESLRSVALGVLVNPSHAGHLHLRNMSTRGYFCLSSVHVNDAPDVQVLDEVSEAQARDDIEHRQRARQSLRDDLGLR